MAWLSGWNKRKSHSIAGSADGVLTDYTKRMLVVRANPATWTAATRYITGQWVIPTTPNGYVYECVLNVTAGASEPTWGTTENGITTDNSVAAWKCRGDIVFAPSVKSDYSDLRFTAADGVTELSHWVQDIAPYHSISRVPLGIHASAIAANGDIYAATATALYKSTDGGMTYGSALISFTSGTRIYCVFIDTVGNVYVSPGSSTVSDADAGLYRSTDGVNFTKVIDMIAEEYIWQMDQGADGRLYAGSYGISANSNRVYYSTDNGATWNYTAIPNTRHNHSLRVDPYNTTNGYDWVYVVAGDTGYSSDFGVFKSVDGGATFTRVIQQQFLALEIVSATKKLVGTDLVQGRIFELLNDSTANIVHMDSGATTDAFWSRKNGNDVYFGFASKSNVRAKILATTNGGETFHEVCGLTTTGTEDGSLYASNFVNGVCLASYAVGAVFQHGIKIIRNNDYAIVHVKIPSIAASPSATDLYCYYGNTSAASTADGAATFPLFDDFPGTTLNESKWAINRSDSLITIAVADSALSVSCTTSSGGVWISRYVKSLLSFSPTARMIAKYTSNNIAAANGPLNFIGYGGSDDANGKMQNAAIWSQECNAAIGVPAAKNRASGTETRNVTNVVKSPISSITRNAASTVITSDIGQTTTTSANNPSGSLPIVIGVERGSASATLCKISVDWVAALPTTANEPLNTTWGTEESTATGDPQTITFGALSATTYGAAPITLTATASSGLPVSYTSSNTGVATVAGSTVTVVGVGTTNITASQAGDGTWAAATPVVQALVVAKADQTISISAPSYKLPTDDPFAVTATASSGLTCTLSILSGPATILDGTVTLTGSLGDVVIRATQAGNANYTAAADTDRPVHVVDVIPASGRNNSFRFGFGFGL